MTLTVQMIESQKDKELPGKGTFVSYKLTVSDGTTETQGVELFQKKDSVPPAVGQSYDYWSIEDGQYGKKIKKAPKVQGGGGFRPRDPRETAAIQRQHSQEMALRWAAVQAARGKLPDDFDLTALKAGADWFQRDIASGVNLEMYGSKDEVRKEPRRTGESDVPVKADEFVHAPQSMEGTPWET